MYWNARSAEHKNNLHIIVQILIVSWNLFRELFADFFFSKRLINVLEYYDINTFLR